MMDCADGEEHRKRILKPPKDSSAKNLKKVPTAVRTKSGGVEEDGWMRKGRVTCFLFGGNRGNPLFIPPMEENKKREVR